MNLFVDWIVLFQVFCVVQGCTTGLWLLTFRPRQPAFLWLGGLVLGLTLQVIDYGMARTGIYAQHNSWYFAPLFFSWGFGPLLYLAIRSWLKKPLRYWGWHLVPMLIQVAFFVFVSFHSLEYKTWFWKTIHKPYTRYIDYYGMCLSMFVYIGLSLSLLPIKQDQFRWYRRPLFGLASFYVVAVVDPLVNQWYLPARHPKFYLTEFVLPVITYWIALLALVRGRSKPASKVKPAIPVSESYLERIVKALEEDKLYRDPDLTLDRLAHQVGLPANTVSLTINAGLGKSLSDYLNELRVKDIKRRLHRGEAEQFSLLGIALEAGFGSKTTFNRVFREQTGRSPSAYLKEYQTTRWDDPNQ
ncbi:helix-turn-helix domain-containing protein [Spirosoma oryzicola]|uniref:helix-turn-helix domain-containing protein n=1 Tax=Spirosoma oryzicola TaxID=2898794 RepID=UPI001E549B40|nr:AraC family transcriptional regulator [Spirosoma oryzicola]UHG94441.1 AraC family transcriptional regulator [Spirosoma oryzicola]